MSLLADDLNEGGEKEGKVSKWARASEFDGPGRDITPVSFRRLCGDQTSAKAEFRDKDGCTFRLVFIDHDSGDLERTYENCYKMFADDVATSRVEKGKRYIARRQHNGTRYVWVFEESGKVI